MLYPSLNFIFSASSASLRMCILESQPTISERIESSWGSSLRYKGCQVFCIIEANRTLFCRQELQNLIIPCSSRRSIAKVQIQKWVNRSVYNCRSIRDVRSLSISEYELTASLNLCQGWMRISVHCNSWTSILKSRRVRKAVIVVKNLKFKLLNSTSHSDPYD